MTEVEKKESKENQNNTPFLQRFEPGVCQKFAIFTILMFAVPLGIFLTFRKTVDNTILIIICLICSFIIMTLYVVMAFNEHFDSDDLIANENMKKNENEKKENDNDKVKNE